MTCCDGVCVTQTHRLFVPRAARSSAAAAQLIASAKACAASLLSVIPSAEMSDAAAASAVVSVRDATLADLQFLVDGNAAMALETENLVLSKDTLRLGCAAMLNDRSKGFYLMAECDGVTAGQLMVTYEHSDWRNGHSPPSSPPACARRHLTSCAGTFWFGTFPFAFGLSINACCRWIQSVYTLPHMRLRGVYRALFSRVQQMAQGAA